MTRLEKPEVRRVRSPWKREIAEDGEIESQRHRRPPGFQPGPATWLVHPPRKAGQSKPVELPTHRLAGEPGAPVQFTFRTLAGSRTRTSEDTHSWGVRGYQLRHQRIAAIAAE
jgi:hypothetical protein